MTSNMGCVDSENKPASRSLTSCEHDVEQLYMHLEHTSGTPSAVEELLCADRRLWVNHGTPYRNVEKTAKNGHSMAVGARDPAESDQPAGQTTSSTCKIETALVGMYVDKYQDPPILSPEMPQAIVTPEANQGHPACPHEW